MQSAEWTASLRSAPVDQQDHPMRTSFSADLQLQVCVHSRRGGEHAAAAPHSYPQGWPWQGLRHQLGPSSHQRWQCCTGHEAYRHSPPGAHQPPRALLFAIRCRGLGDQQGCALLAVCSPACTFTAVFASLDRVRCHGSCTLHY